MLRSKPPARLPPQIRVLVEQIENDRRLPLSLVKAMAAAGIFRMLIPQKLGGVEVDVATMIRVVIVASPTYEMTGRVSLGLNTDTAIL